MRLLVLVLLCSSLFAGDKGKLSELDKEKLKRIQLQLELLQRQVAENFAPITKEQNEILNRVCESAKLKRDECEVNIDLGTVTKVKVSPPKEDKK